MTGDLRLGFVALSVPDVAATCDFYRRAFGLEVRFVDPSGHFAELVTGAARLAVVDDGFAERQAGLAHRRTTPDGPPPGVVCTFFTTDVDAAVDRAIAAGATLTRAPFDAPWGQRIAVVRDGDGALVELATPVD